METKEYLTHQVDALSKRQVEGYRNHLELISKQRATISRNILDDLSELEIFSLRMYGVFGLSINLSLRENRKLLRDKSYAEIRSDLREFRENYQLRELDPRKDIEISQVKSFGLQVELVSKKEGEIAHHLKTLLDNLIERKSPRFYKEGNYFYRVSRAKKNAYGGGGEFQESRGPKIKPGDLISDDALWSSTISSDIALSRYSKISGSPSHSTPLADDEEELLFMIENNASLKAIDISGYKFPKEWEGETGGEMLIKSSTKFKVIGVQKTEKFMDRRIVVLKPLNSDSIKDEAIFKNPFSGNTMRRLWFKPVFAE